MKIMRDSFFGARVFGMQLRDGKTIQGVLMPFIDFLNHNNMARGYKLDKTSSGDPETLWTYGDRPVAGSRECFVHYAPLDRLDNFIYGSFFDKHSPFLKSIPLTLVLQNNIQIHVSSDIQPAFSTSSVSDSAKDLAMFLPEITEQDENSVRIRRLLIPNLTYVTSLRRILYGLISNLAPSASRSWITGAVKDAEVQLLRVNMAYYQNLQRTCAWAASMTPPDAMPGRDSSLATLQRMAKVQQDHIAAYVQYTGILL